MTAARWHEVPRAIRPGHVLLAIGVLAAVACAWPVLLSRGTDFNWRVALHAAAQAGMSHGSDIAFTYGPLGFLGFPDPFLGWTSALATVCTGLTLTGLAVMLGISLLGWLPWWLAAPALVVVMRAASLANVVDLQQTLVFGAALLVLRSRRPLPIQALAVAGGVAGAFLLLSKLNAGIAAIAIVLVVAGAVGRPWWRAVLLAAASTAGGTLLLWLVAGQRLADLPSYARAAFEIVSGYSAAMSTASPGPPGALPAAALALVLVTIPVVRCAAALPRRAGAGLVAAWVIQAGTLYLEGFTRGDRGHIGIFFSTVLFAAVLVVSPGSSPIRGPDWLRSWQARLPRGTGSVAAVAALATVVALVLAFGPMSVSRFVDPRASLSKLVSNAGAAIRPWAWDRLATLSRQRILAGYALDPALVPLLDGRTVHVDPILAGLATVLPGVRWDPEPVFQSYQAYTPWLDQLDAGFLAGPRAPERILRQNPVPYVIGAGRPTTVDHRLLAWEQPAATLEMVCRYRELAVSGGWQVLARGASRCGEPTTIGTVSGVIGTPVTVPAAAGDQVVIVRISPLQGGFLERAAALVLRSPVWFADVDGTRYRLVPGTAGDGLLLALPASVGWSQAFTFGPPVRTLTIIGPDTSRSAQLTYVFQAISLAEVR